jgi:hypothetical protein
MELLGPRTRDPQYIYSIVKRAPGAKAIAAGTLTLDELQKMALPQRAR